MAAISRLPVTFVFTHDSIGVGEDGPTHQPIEQLMSLRLIPNLWVIRPADANEVVEAYQIAMKRGDGPIAVVLTRQKTPTFDRSKLAPAKGVQKGGYVLADVPDPQVVLIATGSEVALALAAQEKVAGPGNPGAGGVAALLGDLRGPKSRIPRLGHPTRHQGSRVHRGWRHAGLATLAGCGGRRDRHRPLRRVGSGWGSDEAVRIPCRRCGQRRCRRGEGVKNIGLSLLLAAVVTCGLAGTARADAEKPGVFTFAFQGLAVGSVAGLAAGYLVARDDGWQTSKGLEAARLWHRHRRAGGQRDWADPGHCRRRAGHSRTHPSRLA